MVLVNESFRRPHLSFFSSKSPIVGATVSREIPILLDEDGLHLELIPVPPINKIVNGQVEMFVEGDYVWMLHGNRVWYRCLPMNDLEQTVTLTISQSIFFKITVDV